MPVQPIPVPAGYASGHSPAPSQARLLSALATFADVLAPGEALNLPAVLDRSALLDALSMLTTDTTTRTATPHVAPRRPLDRIAVTALLLDDMTNGERAVAIHAAGIPANWRILPVDQITDLALTGIARLGLPTIRRIDGRSRELNLSPQLSPSDEAELRRIWTSERLHQAATDLAWRLSVDIRRNTSNAVTQ